MSISINATTEINIVSNLSFALYNLGGGVWSRLQTQTILLEKNNISLISSMSHGDSISSISTQLMFDRERGCFCFNDLVINKKLRKLSYIKSQLLVVNRRLEEEENRYKRASQNRCQLHHGYNSRMRLCVYHGVRDMYSAYAARLGDEIRQVMTKNMPNTPQTI